MSKFEFEFQSIKEELACVVVALLAPLSNTATAELSFLFGA